MVAHINAVGIYLELGAGCPILEIVPSVVFSHESAFHKGLERHFIVVVHPEALPPVAFGMQEHQVVNLADGCEILAADFHTLDGILVA